MEWWRRYKTRHKQAKCECHDFEHRRARTSWHYQIKDRRVLGATLSWGMKAVPYEETDFECDWCGRQFSRRGYVPGLLWRLSYPPDYDGWPTLDGVRLPVWTQTAVGETLPPLSYGAMAAGLRVRIGLTRSPAATPHSLR